MGGAKAAIEGEKYVKAVTHANLALGDKHLTSVMEKLAQEGIQFIDVHDDREGEDGRR